MRMRGGGVVSEWMGDTGGVEMPLSDQPKDG